MVKFSAKMDANKFEDWPYIDYKAIKKLLKSGSLQSSPFIGRLQSSHVSASSHVGTLVSLKLR